MYGECNFVVHCVCVCFLHTIEMTFIYRIMELCNSPDRYLCFWQHCVIGIHGGMCGIYVDLCIWKCCSVIGIFICTNHDVAVIYFSLHQ